MLCTSIIGRGSNYKSFSNFINHTQLNLYLSMFLLHRLEKNYGSELVSVRKHSSVL